MPTVHPHRPAVEPLEQRRLLSAGDLDPTFGTDGTSVLGSTAGPYQTPSGTGAFVQPGTGDVVVVRSDGTVARFTPAGGLDTTFGTAGTVAAPYGTALAPVAAVGGGAFAIAGKTDAGTVTVTKFTVDGHVDAAFGLGGTATVPRAVGAAYDGGPLGGEAAMAVGPDGTIYVGLTYATQLGPGVGTYRLGLATVSAAGQPAGPVRVYPGFSPNPVLDYTQLFGMAVSPTTGRIVLDARGYLGTDANGQAAGLLLGLTPAGDVDPTFGTDGVLSVVPPTTSAAAGAGTYVDALTFDAGDRLLVAATAALSAGDQVLLARYTADGRPDPTFGDGGFVLSADPLGTPTADDYGPAGGDALLVGPDGSVTVGGIVQGQALLVRYDPTGHQVQAAYTSAGTPGLPPVIYPGGSGVNALADGGGGRVIAFGTRLFRVNADLSPDATFANGYQGYVPRTDGTVGVRFVSTTAAVPTATEPDGKLVLLGIGTSPLTGADVHAIRLSVDGQLDPTFNPAFTTTATAVAAQADGKLLVAGGTTPGVVRLNIDGSVDATFAAPPAVLADALEVDPMADGRVVVVAGADVYRFTAAGVADATFGTGGRAAGGAARAATGAFVTPDGSVYTVGGPVLERFTPAGQADAAFGAAGQVTLAGSDDSLVADVIVERSSGRVVVVGGSSFTAYTSAGVLDPTVAANPSTPESPPDKYGFVRNPYLTGLTEQADGSLVAFGPASAVRVRPDLSPDPTFDSFPAFTGHPTVGGSTLAIAGTRAFLISAAATDTAQTAPQPVSLSALDLGPASAVPPTATVTQLTGLPLTPDAYGPTHVTPFGPSLLYYAANPDDGTGRTYLYRTDGTVPGTQIVTGPDGQPVSDVNGILAAADHLYVGVGGSNGGVTPAVYQLMLDAPASTQLPLPASAYGWTPLAVDAAGRLLLYGGPDAVGLYATDGTAAGTTELAELPAPAGVPVANSSSGVLYDRTDPAAVVAGNGTVYLVTNGRLTATDGTAAGTRTLRTFTTGTGNDATTDQLDHLTAVGNRAVVFDARAAVLYGSDGTAAGTAALGGPTTVLSGPMPIGDQLYFATTTNYSSGVHALYVTDGTAAGTADLTATRGLPAPDGQTFTPLAADRLVYSAAAETTTTEDDDDTTTPRATPVYVTDGTAAGTAELLAAVPADADVPTPIAQPSTTAPTAYFTRTYATSLYSTAAVLFRTDGTAAGTTAVAAGFPPAAPPLLAAGTVLGQTRDVSYYSRFTFPATTVHFRPGQLFALTTLTPTPTPTPGPTPTPTPTGPTSVTASTLPASAVAGSRHVRGTLRVQVADSTAKATRTVVRAYITDAAGQRRLVGTGRHRVAAGGTATVPMVVRLPPLSAGSYTLAIESSDGTTAVGPTVIMDAAVVDLSTSVTLPSTLTPGRSAVVTVTVANAGNVPAAGRLTVSLALAHDGGLAAAPLVNAVAHATVRPGRPIVLRRRVRLPATLAAGSYDPLLSVAVNGTPAVVTGATDPVVVA